MIPPFYSHRPLAALFRDAKTAEDFLNFLFAERAKRKKPPSSGNQKSERNQFSINWLNNLWFISNETKFLMLFICRPLNGK